MTRIKNEIFRGKKAIVGSFEVEYDEEGIAEVDDAVAHNVKGIPGFTILPDLPPEPKVDIEIEIEPDADPSTIDPPTDVAQEPDADIEIDPSIIDPPTDVVREPEVDAEIAPVIVREPKTNHRGRPTKNHK